MDSKCIETTPLAFLQPDAPLALILINRDISNYLEIFRHLYKKSKCTCYVDGANNYFFDYNLYEDYPPDFISGDFDSIRPEVMDHCKEAKYSIRTTPDQDETDLTKAINLVDQELGSNQTPIVVIGDTGGRIDHGLSIFASIYRAQVNCKETRLVYLLNDSSIGQILFPGIHSLKVNTGYEGEHCGFLPFDGPCHLKTTGVVWTMDDELSNKGIISTCNKLKDALITTHSNGVVIFTLDYLFHSLPKNF